MKSVVHRKRGFDLVNADVTNHCNARCFFCFNDWDSFKPCNMSVETFRKLLTLLPLTQGRDFLISCWFEPTINPDFYKMLSLLPPEYKEKVYFTTNLVAEIDDDDMVRMCSANVDHINISVETYDPEVYPAITGVKKTHFFDNIEKLARYKEKYGTDIRVITMLTEKNKDELPSILKRTFERLHPSEHEIRTPYFFVEDTGTKEKLIGEMLTKAQVDAVREQVDAFGYTHLLWETTFTRELFEKMEQNHQLHFDATDGLKYRLRVSADGTARIGHQKKGKVIDLNAADDPASLMRKELILLQKKDARDWLVTDACRHIRMRRSDALHNLDSAELYDDRFLSLTGWETGSLAVDDKERIVYAECAGKGKMYRLRDCARQDVADAFGKQEYADSGYTALIDLKGFEDRYFRVYTGVKKGENVDLLQCIYEGNKESINLRERVRRRFNVAFRI